MATEPKAKVVRSGRAPAHRSPGAALFVRHVGTLVVKDLRLEFRSREILYTMAFFAAMVVLIFAFAFVRESASGQLIPISEVAPGFVWIAMLFAGTLGLSRVFDRERESDTMRGLLMAPVPRAAIFLGKAVSVLVFIVAVLVVVTPLTLFWFDAPLFREPLPVICALLLGALGVATTGSTLAAMLLRARSRDALLPVALYPLLAPLLIAGIKACAGAMEADLDNAWFWVKFLLVYDALFLTASLWIFDLLVIE